MPPHYLSSINNGANIAFFFGNQKILAQHQIIHTFRRESNIEISSFFTYIL